MDEEEEEEEGGRVFERGRKRETSLGGNYTPRVIPVTRTFYLSPQIFSCLLWVEWREMEADSASTPTHSSYSTEKEKKEKLLAIDRRVRYYLCL